MNIKNLEFFSCIRYALRYNTNMNTKYTKQDIADLQNMYTSTLNAFEAINNAFCFITVGGNTDNGRYYRFRSLVNRIQEEADALEEELDSLKD